MLLIRGAVVRSRGGWPRILLLGVAYELVEDGIGLQALSSPCLYYAADRGPRLLGLNTTYWEANVAPRYGAASASRRLRVPWLIRIEKGLGEAVRGM